MARTKIIKRTIDKLNRKPLVNPKRKKRPNAAEQQKLDDKTTITQAEAHVAAVYDAAGVIPSSTLPLRPTLKMVIAGGRAAYTSFLRESGYAHDARVPDYDKLKVMHHARWEKIAADVYRTMGGEK